MPGADARGHSANAADESLSFQPSASLSVFFAVSFFLPSAGESGFPERIYTQAGRQTDTGGHSANKSK